MNEKYVGRKGEGDRSPSSSLPSVGDVVGRSRNSGISLFISFHLLSVARKDERGVESQLVSPRETRNYEQVSEVERDSQTDSDFSSARRVILDEITWPP